MAKFVRGQSGNPGGRPKSAGLRELARTQTEACVHTLIKIRDSAKAPAAARIAAVKELLDRGYGKSGPALTPGADGDGKTEFIVRWIVTPDEATPDPASN